MRNFVIAIILILNAANLQAAVFTVTSNSDSGDGSLRETILKANANGTADVDIINFNLQGSDLANITISLKTELPILTSNIIIDGTSQPTSILANPNIKVCLVRAADTYFNGLRLDNASAVEIYGLSFSNFKADPQGSIDEKKGAIYLYNSLNIRIGSPNKPNCFGNNYAGILSPFVIPKVYVENIVIKSNIFGLSENGMNVMPNDSGIDLSFFKNGQIGGDTPEEGNLITANVRNGIALGAAEGAVRVLNNIIGVDKALSFRPAPAAIGIYINGASCTPIISENIIGGQLKGILLDYINAGFTISGNKIGTALSGNENYPNTTGIHINFSNFKGIIGGSTNGDRNFIANNEVGIIIENSYPVSILKNSIFCNRKAAIEFKDLPTGKTITQSKINVITSNSASGLYLPNAVVELFYDDECPDCQGKFWIATLQTDANGNWEYNGPLTGSLTSTGTNMDGATSGFSKPVISDASKKINDVFCGAANGSITGLVISDASVFTWFNAANQQVGNLKDLTNVPAGVYYLKAGQPGGCDILSATYTIKNIPVNYKVKSSTITPASCNLENGSVFITAYESEKPNNFSWTNDKGIEISNAERLENVADGRYTLTASNGSGCTNIVGEFIVGAAQAPFLDITKMQQLISCDGKTISATGIEIIGDTAPYTYKWIDNDGSVVYDGLNIVNVKAGKYTLQVTDKYGCTVNSEELDFMQLENKVLQIPNTISPNGDGINDTWKINGAVNYPNAEFYVFNRNGEKIFNSKGYNKEFDGTRNGKPLAVGVYYYVIDLKTDCGKLSGSLTILK
ncbi:gliding motility-associated C-terminal domain-containing protein [Pedobacter sp. Leaf132]|uniref:T9SS type B sorting domain-containing protein n=1 Tax=Pedobacter sp. Leaf132 TaxID=2876557 RepID=UPI001E556317|nr:gliding motility-associated C-terminal domain-containing protein [Pedobacter sp. Leaf132]